jgi:1,4-dihydroxy-2-naphthoate octaprenyltransferase
VPGPDHLLASTQPINPLGADSLAALQAREAQRRLRLRLLLNQPPRTLLGTLAHMTRWRAALALTMPVFCGAMLAWWELGQLNPLTLGFHVATVFTLALGIHALMEYHDYKRALAANAQSENELLATGYGLMMHGRVAPELAVNLGHILLAISILCSLWLALLAGWPALFFMILSFVLIYGYTSPPFYSGYRGWGLGELSLLLGFGLLPVLNSYYVQSGALHWLACVVGLPFGLLSMLIFFNYNLVFEHRDWLMWKRTFVVEVGPLRALDIGSLLTVAVHVAILAIVSLAQLPFSTLLTLAALPFALNAFSQLRRETITVEDSFQLYRTTVTAMLWIGLLFSTALIANRWL